MSSLELAFDTPPASTGRRSSWPPTAACWSSTTSAASAARSVELLNRWITPLESRTDYLTLTSGQKLPVPFVVLIVLATNIKPADLVDEAFLRRIHYKVFAESPTAADVQADLQPLLPRARASTTTRRSSTRLVDAGLQRSAASRCAAASRATSSTTPWRSPITWASHGG